MPSHIDSMSTLTLVDNMMFHIHGIDYWSNTLSFRTSNITRDIKSSGQTTRVTVTQRGHIDSHIPLYWVISIPVTHFTHGFTLSVHYLDGDTLSIRLCLIVSLVSYPNYTLNYKLTQVWVCSQGSNNTYAYLTFFILTGSNLASPLSFSSISGWMIWSTCSSP